MKKYLVIIAAILTFTSCATYKDIKINSLKVEKLTLLSSSPSATLAVEIDNPIGDLKIVAMSAVLKVSGENAMQITCSPFELRGRSCDTYSLDVTGTIDPEFSMAKIVKIAQAQDLKNIKIDIVATAKNCIGLKYTKVLKDIPLWPEE